jgi:hypothetical protein
MESCAQSGVEFNVHEVFRMSVHYLPPGIVFGEKIVENPGSPVKSALFEENNAGHSHGMLIQFAEISFGLLEQIVFRYFEEQFGKIVA